MERDDDIYMIFGNDLVGIKLEHLDLDFIREKAFTIIGGEDKRELFEQLDFVIEGERILPAYSQDEYLTEVDKHIINKFVTLLPKYSEVISIFKGEDYLKLEYFADYKILTKTFDTPKNSFCRIEPKIRYLIKEHFAIEREPMAK